MRQKARESKVEEILRDIAWRKSGKMGCCFVKSAQDLQEMCTAESAQETNAPKMRESHTKHKHLRI